MTTAAAPAISVLRELELFHDLEEGELGELKRLGHCAKFRADTTIMIAEQPGEVVYFVLDGFVKVFVEQLGDTDVIFAILGPGEMVGELGLADALGLCASTVTITSCRLLWIERDALQRSMKSMPAMHDNLLRILAGRLRKANAQIEALCRLDVYGRVARELLVLGAAYGSLAEESEVVIAIPLTQNDLAGIVGASRARVNQVLGALARLEWITVDQDSRITLRNPAALAQRCWSPELAAPFDRERARARSLNPHS